MKDGHGRERQVKKLLEDDGWLVIKAGGSLGPVDLAAMRSGFRPRLIQVKGNEGSPWKCFGPADRIELRQIAIASGADAELVHWPSRQSPHFIPSAAWPEQQRKAA